MSMEPGWYPDPFSSGGYVRWWDGQRWGASTSIGTAAPSSNPPGAPVLLPPPPPMPSDPDASVRAREQAPFPLASWPSRAVARILDSVIESLLAAPFVLLMLRPAFQRLLDAMPSDGSMPSQAVVDSFWTDALPYAGWITTVTVVVSFLYQVPQNVRWGRTVGKRALGIRIRPLVADVPLTWVQATVRWATYAAFSLVLGGVLIFVDLLWPLWDRPWQQALHDKTARTVVVPTRLRPGQAPSGP